LSISIRFMSNIENMEAVMKYITKINRDLFNIVKRLKAIDKKYFVVFNHKFKRFEIHNASQFSNTLSLVCPYPKLDIRVLDLVIKTRVERGAELLDKIEKHNQKLEEIKTNNALDYSSCMLKEIHSYALKGGKDFDYRKAYLNDWI